MGTILHWVLQGSRLAKPETPQISPGLLAGHKWEPLAPKQKTL